MMRYTTVHSTIIVLLYHFYTRIYDTMIMSMIKSRHREAPNNSVKVQVSCKDVPEELQKTGLTSFCNSITGHPKLHLYVQYLSQ
jgi:hypothetical protein